MDAPSLEQYALCPLTVFDKLFERTAFVTGWLVQGIVDSAALESALRRVTEKWRMLAGRLISVKTDNVTQWYIKVPLGPLPAHHASYTLTTVTSELPLSHYVPIPLPMVSASLPYNVFVHPSTPRQYSRWESVNHPLTCWHLTYFSADPVNNVPPYTCIGFARCHGVFDGVGAGFIMNALVAEMNGSEWHIPPLPQLGLNVNPIEELIRKSLEEKDQFESDYAGLSVLSTVGIVKLVALQLREKLWRGAGIKIVLMPKQVLDSLVSGVREKLEHRCGCTEKPTTGDVLVAWLLKTIYSSGTSLETKVHCSNLASFRSKLSSSESVLKYPHNAFIPLHYPILTVKDIIQLSLPALTRRLTAPRVSFSSSQAIAAYKMLQSSPRCFPQNSSSDETLIISNVSASRILESDWRSVGGEKTVCGYRYQLNPTEILLTNTVYIAGRLTDGSVVLDTTLNTARLGLLMEEIERLVQTSI